jgi:OPT oligopeptide transporter protein
VVAELCGVSALALALGMYLPMDLNSPLVAGAAVAWLLRRSSKDPKVAGARHERGTLIASGFIAGGALVGVFAALLRYGEDVTGRTLVPDLTKVPGLGPALASNANVLGLLAFAALSVFVYVVSRRSAHEADPRSP